jgi:hypothetical protein
MARSGTPRIERTRCRLSSIAVDEEINRKATSPEAEAWIAAAKDLTELHVSMGLERGPATLKAVSDLF